MDVLDASPIFLRAVNIAIVPASDLPEGIRRVPPVCAGDHLCKKTRIFSFELGHDSLGKGLFYRAEDVAGERCTGGNEEVDVLGHEDVGPHEESVLGPGPVQVLQEDPSEVVVQKKWLTAIGGEGVFVDFAFLVEGDALSPFGFHKVQFTLVLGFAFNTSNPDKICASHQIVSGARSLQFCSGHRSGSPEFGLTTATGHIGAITGRFMKYQSD